MLAATLKLVAMLVNAFMWLISVGLFFVCVAFVIWAFTGYV